MMFTKRAMKTYPTGQTLGFVDVELPAMAGGQGQIVATNRRLKSEG
jgi:hypothetical protein